MCGLSVESEISLIVRFKRESVIGHNFILLSKRSKIKFYGLGDFDTVNNTDLDSRHSTGNSSTQLRFIIFKKW